MTLIPPLRLGAATLSLAVAAALAGPNDTIVDTLFNGRDLQGWDIKTMGRALNSDPQNTWRVAGGNLEVNYSNYNNSWAGSPWSHLYYRRSYSHYLLRMEYQFYGTQVSGAPSYANQNSGVMIHSQSAASMALNQNWPISLEAQFLGPANTNGSPNPRGTMNLCTPGTAFRNANSTPNLSHCVDAAANTRTLAPSWTRVSALVLGDSIIRHYVENQVVLTYYKPYYLNDDRIVSGDTLRYVKGASLTQGYIALQSESAPIRFRNIHVINLKGCKNPASPNYKSYYVISDPAACQPTVLRSARPGSAYSYDPAGILNLDFPGMYILRLSDLSGKTVWQGKGQGKSRFTIQSLKPGLYLLALRHPNGVLNAKLLLGQ